MAATGRKPDSFTACLREVGLWQLSKRFPKTFHEWAKDVRDDFGSVNERTLYRCIKWLVERGAVRVLDEPAIEHYDSDGGSRHWAAPVRQFIRVMDKIPPAEPRCGICRAFGHQKNRCPNALTWNVSRRKRNRGRAGRAAASTPDPDRCAA